MPTPLTRCSRLLIAVLAFAPRLATGADEPKETPVEVYDWSIWVGSPAQPALNASRAYRNAMPKSVGTSRPNLDDEDRAGRFPVAPISVVQFFGEACTDVDVDLRTTKGSLLAHWPPGTERSGRIQWFGSKLSAEPPAGLPLGYVNESHEFQELRGVGPALYLENESRVERFLAYDAELTVPIPIKIRGGPDEYTLQNLTDRRLLDVAVIAPAEGGFRVGWLDELPTMVPEKEAEDDPKPKVEDEAKVAEKVAKKAGELFQDAEPKPEGDGEKDQDKEKDDPIPPLPAEADAEMRARVDQVLNRPINLAPGEAPRREVLGLVFRQARLAFEVDDRTLAKAGVDLDQAMETKAGSPSARDALADVIGPVGLSYRVAEDGRLFITTAARIAEESGKKGRVIEGPPVALVMSRPVRPTDPSYRDLTREALARRLEAQGLRADLAQVLLDQYGPPLFEQDELIVLAHLSREALDDAVLLDVFPPPRKFVRVATLLVHGVDPRLQDRARELVRRLGDPASAHREEAEGRLFELGPVAVPALEDALTDKDAEIVFRSERLLLRLNRAVP